ncbi:MAG TPA: glycosyltransferase [Gemmatimonadaceae bacterium]|nr:glycosyltransferase [Gemmatimonadaceae bacterium]
MRTVLLISYTFPPQYDVSARRAAKLCKYLPGAGWRPIVLTKDWTRDVAPEDRSVFTVTEHAEALAALNGVTIVRAPYRTRDNPLRRLHHRLGGSYESAASTAPTTGPRDDEPLTPNGVASRVDPPLRRWTPLALTRRTLSLLSPTFGDFPDAFRGWVAPAVRSALEVINRERVDAILSLCPPATAHVVAAEVARRTGLPWVAQFDDLYSFHLERQRRAEWRPYADRRHREWMRHATLAGAITPAMLAYVQRTYGVDGDVVVVGYDPDESPSVRREAHERLRLAYTGSIYPGDQRPDLLFAALERVIRERGGVKPPLELIFAGTGRDAELRASLAAFPAAARACRFVGRVPPNEALRLQRESDGLVLLNCTNPSRDEGTLSYPAKTFEYLNAGRPILALPRDPGAWGDRLLETTRAGTTAESADAAAAVLARWLDEWERTGEISYSADRDEIERYSQPRQAAVLGSLLDRAMDIHAARTV